MKLIKKINLNIQLISLLYNSLLIDYTKKRFSGLKISHQFRAYLLTFFLIFDFETVKTQYCAIRNKNIIYNCPWWTCFAPSNKCFDIVFQAFCFDINVSIIQVFYIAIYLIRLGFRYSMIPKSNTLHTTEDCNITMNNVHDCIVGLNLETDLHKCKLFENQFISIAKKFIY
jgi:hypothetical protein